MSAIEKRVFDETQRFQAALPELMKKYPARWVVFKDGQVQGDYDNGDGAYLAAIEKFGVDGGFVIAPVASIAPTPVTAGVLFGIR